MGARALINPIDWEEPFGLVVIEAMACGTPVIATRRGACPEIVDHGRTGVLVDNYREMEDPAVLELADSLDPVVIRKEVEERFSPEHMVANYVAAYEATIAATRSALTLRSPYDREILKLALPALGALAAEPLYLLVDTAIVGHLGRTELAALGIAFTVLGGTFAIFNFLQYGTTAQVARAGGAGQDGDRAPARRAGGLALARVRDRRVGADRGVRSAARRRSSAARARRRTSRSRTCGSPRSASPRRSSRSARQGYLRGVADLRTPLVVVIAGERRERVPRGALRLRLRLGNRRLGGGNGDRAARDGSGVRRRRAAAARARRGAGAARARAARALAREVDLHPHDGADGLVRARRRGGDALGGRRDRRAPGRVPALRSSSRSCSTRSRSRARSSSGASSAPAGARRPTARASG